MFNKYKEVKDGFLKERITAQYIHIKLLKKFNVKFILGIFPIDSIFFPQPFAVNFLKPKNSLGSGIKRIGGGNR